MYMLIRFVANNLAVHNLSESTQHIPQIYGQVDNLKIEQMKLGIYK